MVGGEEEGEGRGRGSRRVGRGSRRVGRGIGGGVGEGCVGVGGVV